MKKLIDICDIQYGYAFDSKCFTDDSCYPPLVRIRDVKRGYSETYYSGDYPKEYVLASGDLLVGMDGEFNIARWKCDGALLNQRVCKLIAKKGTNEEYLRFAMTKALKEIERRTAFVTVKHLSAKELNKLQLSVPDLSKQNRVAEILSRLEKVIDFRRQELQKLDNLIKARFVEMFGDPIKNPKEYPVHQLSEYITSLTSGSRGWARYCVDDGNEWFITIKNVKDCHIITDNMQPVNAPDNAEAKRTKVQEGDLLISITADLGRTGVVTKEIAEHGAYINQHLSCIRINKEVLKPLFVAHYMESPAGKEQFAAKNQNAVKAGLNFNSINSLRLIVPPIREQEDFINFINQVNKSKVAVLKNYSQGGVLSYAN